MFKNKFSEQYVKNFVTKISIIKIKLGKKKVIKINDLKRIDKY